MQKLRERNTYTPTDIPHVRGNCDSQLNSPEGRGSVAHLKTSLNNPDAALTACKQAGQDLRVPAVYVQSKRGKPLMPTTPRKARRLLKEGRAVVAKRTPFTIRLLFITGEALQPVFLGVDGGYSHMGLSAISEKKELYCEEVLLREDIVKLNAERRQYRRSRRSRKTWYRKSRFLNRGKTGWIAPSLQNKLRAHLKAIEKVGKILPLSQIMVEVASFDIQKLQNMDIERTDYQQGVQWGFANVRAYVLHRDHHICQHCKGRSKESILHVHHIESRQTGGDRPDNLITLCSSCHREYHEGNIVLKVKRSPGFKAETFMTTIRRRLIDLLCKRTIPVTPSYGYITKQKREDLNIIKSHINDAFIIAGGTKQERSPMSYFTKQVRKCNRKLFKGDRSHLPNKASRFIQGFQRFDKVLWMGIECFIFGRRSSGYFDIRLLNGIKIHASAKIKDLKIVESARTFLTEKRSAHSSDSIRLSGSCANFL